MIGQAQGQTAQARPAQGQASGSISGVVTISGRPAVGIAVTLHPDDVAPDRATLAKVTTDAAGKFAFTGVAAGNYIVSAFAPAHTIASPEAIGETGKRVSAADGEQVADFTIPLVRGGVITGRITDHTGRPVVGEDIRLDVITEGGKPRRIYPANWSLFESDDRGVYRAYGLAPGRYLVSVGESPSDGGVRMGFGNTYQTRLFYPGVTDEARAQVVEVTPGGEASQIDLKLARPGRALTVIGKMVDADTGRGLESLRYAIGGIRPDGKSMGGFLTPNMRTDSGGEFRIEGVTPGRYAVFVIPDPGSDFYSDVAVVDLSDKDVGGLEIKVHKGASLSGVAIIDGDPPAEVAAKIATLSLATNYLPTEQQGGQVTHPRASPMRLGPDGSFKLSGLRPGKLSLFLAGFPPPKGFSVIRVEVDGIEQKQFDIKDASPITGVRVVIAYGTGAVRGKVQVEGALPAGVALHAVIRREGAVPTTMDIPVPVDARGQFLFDGLAPGDYEVTVSAYASPSTGQPLDIPTAKRAVKVTNGAESDLIVVFKAGGRASANEQ